jgi:acyl-CoA thioesterase-1
VSGDTSAGGLRRLEWALDGDVKILILALGANDALRGLSVMEMRRNLEAIIQGAQERGVTVLLAGMEAPPNYGLEYTVQFRQVYRDLAREHDLVSVPFLLEGVAGQSTYNQSDGIHPNREGARLVAETIWRALKPMIDAAASS